MRISLIVIAAVCFAPIQAARAAIVFTYSGGSPTSQQNITYGFRFTPAQDIQVDSLGFFDFGSDGLSASHTTGIWTLNGGTLLASTVVTTANSTLAGATFDGGQFRFTPITPLALTAGTTYVFGAAESGSTDVFYFGGTQISNAPSLATVSTTGNFQSSGTGFAYPDNNVGNTYGLGSFTATPEPSTLGVAAVTTILSVRRRRRGV